MLPAEQAISPLPHLKRGAKKVTGVDISCRWWKWALKNQEQNLNDKIVLLEGDSSTCYLKQIPFDACTLPFCVAANFENLQLGLNEIYRVLQLERQL
ncbi:MAG: methyltransferase domain-containing protein [Bacteroidetes bacterium]|nr:methyltransferase domain-containing protein [Bacteroidota bacterium]